MKQIQYLIKGPSGMGTYLSEDPTESKSWGEFKSHDADNSYKQLVGAAQKELLPNEANLLPSFFSTSRRFFGEIAEQILAKYPQIWR